MRTNYVAKFETIIKELLDLMDYTIRGLRGDKRGYETVEYFVDKGYDFQIDKEELQYVAIKFYRSKSIPAKTLKEMAHMLAYRIKDKGEGSGLLIINTIAPDIIKDDILKEYGIKIWDRQTLYLFLTQYSTELRDDFEKLLHEAQQGTEVYDVFEGLVLEEPVAPYGHLNRHIERPDKAKGERLRDQLAAIRCGRDFWHRYEEVCKEILEYLFYDDLVLWEKQNRTDDGLSRFDLICRIASNDDFWKALISSFNSRFILFECKNYCKPITQDQVYTTERYLFTKALRSVAFIITANGISEGAEQAAKGALKENGKLILFLTNDDLRNMLELKDKLESCNDYLSNLLDKWLITLSR